MASSSLSSIFAPLGYLWRVFATGLGFVVFGLGGVAIASAVAIRNLWTPSSRQAPRTRGAISRSFKLYINFLKACGLLSYEVRGVENLGSNQLIVANHPSLLDVVFLISLVDEANCVVKASLWRNPMTRGAVTAAGYVKNDSEDFFDECVASLKRGESLIIFPEGTRSVPGQPLKLLRSAANVAISAKHNFTPVSIRCEPSTLLKGEKWYRVPKQVPRWVITFHPDMAIDAFLTKDQMQSKTARELTTYLTQFFAEKQTDRAADTPDAEGHAKTKACGDAHANPLYKGKYAQRGT